MLYQRIPTPRPAPRIVLKNAWQVEQGKLSSSEKSCAEEDLLKIDLRVQGVRQSALLEDQGRMTKIRELVKALRTEYRTESAMADSSETGEFNRFSEDSQKTVPKLGNIDLFELGEVSKKIQCSSCATYWPEGLLYCTCGICLLPSTEQQVEKPNQHIPQHMRFRQRPIEEKAQLEREWK